ncbi:MAG: alpha-E domain-containing protein [Thermoleophilia bacterium]
MTMLARVAESLYWMARALERADTYTRLLEVSHAMTREGGGLDGGGRVSVWEPLVDITGDLDAFLAAHHAADERSVPWFLTFAAGNPNSVMSCIRRARQNAHGIRELLPPEVWEALNSLYLDLSAWPPGRLTREGVYPFARQVRSASALVQGLIDGGMRHDAAWQFLRLGRYVERAEKTARLLEVKFHILSPRNPALIAPSELHQWRSVLSCVGADEAYLRMDNGVGSPQDVARFLVVDARFPRSVAFSLERVADGVAMLVDEGVMRAEDAPTALIQRALTELSDATPALWNGALASSLDRVQRRCNEIDAAIGATCFAYPGGEEGSRQRAQAARQAQN